MHYVIGRGGFGKVNIDDKFKRSGELKRKKLDSCTQ
jgi:hypothetical protein